MASLSYDDYPEPTDEELDSVPFPGSEVRLYTSADRRSWMDGVVTDFVDNPSGGNSEPELRVWFNSRVVTGGQPKDICSKRWVLLSAVEVTGGARDFDDEE